LDDVGGGGVIEITMSEKFGTRHNEESKKSLKFPKKSIKKYEKN
jgi:hypothetical protein